MARVWKVIGMRRLGLSVLAIVAVTGAIGRAEEARVAREPNTLFIGEQVVGAGRVTRLSAETRPFRLSGGPVRLAWSPGSDRLVWAADAWRQAKVSLVPFSPAGPDPKRIVTLYFAGYPVQCLWSPSGSHFAVWTQGGDSERNVQRSALWLVSADGQQRRIAWHGRLPATSVEPTWSPDGASIAFACVPEGERPSPMSDGEVLVVNVQTGQSRQPGDHGVDLEFSPDSRALAYVMGVPQFFGAKQYYRVRYDLRSGEKTEKATDWKSSRFASLMLGALGPVQHLSPRMVPRRWSTRGRGPAT